MSETVLIDAASVAASSASTVEAFATDGFTAISFRVECTQAHDVKFYVADADFSAITAAALLPDETRTAVVATTGTDGNLYVVDPGAKAYIAAVVTNNSATTAATVTIAAETPEAAATALFSVSDARAFDKGQLADLTAYTGEDIVLKEAEVRAWLEDICGVNFVATSHTETHDGDGSDYLILKWPKVTAVSAISIDGTALSAGELSTTDYSDGLAIDGDKGIITRRSGIFDAGWHNAAVTYTAGHATVPDRVKRVALRMCVAEMPASNVPFAADDYDAGGMSVSFGRGDGFQGNWSRDPEVVAVIRAYGYRVPGIA